MGKFILLGLLLIAAACNCNKREKVVSETKDTISTDGKLSNHNRIGRDSIKQLNIK